MVTGTTTEIISQDTPFQNVSFSAWDRKDLRVHLNIKISSPTSRGISSQALMISMAGFDHIPQAVFHGVFSTRHPSHADRNPRIFSFFLFFFFFFGFRLPTIFFNIQLIPYMKSIGFRASKPKTHVKGSEGKSRIQWAHPEMSQNGLILCFSNGHVALKIRSIFLGGPLWLGIL